jgi:hypothetical protein
MKFNVSFFSPIEVYSLRYSSWRYPDYSPSRTITFVNQSLSLMYLLMHSLQTMEGHTPSNYTLTSLLVSVMPIQCHIGRG